MTNTYSNQFLLPANDNPPRLAKPSPNTISVTREKERSYMKPSSRFKFILNISRWMLACIVIVFSHLKPTLSQSSISSLTTLPF